MKSNRVCSEVTRKKISEGRKKWLKDNPELHPWRKKSKFQSVPCENVKNYFKKCNIEFVEEYQPMINDRYFSIDIAIPDKMIAIEINGNQHYEKDGSLKKYYKDRHDLLEMNGWVVHEIHYSFCFNPVAMEALALNLNSKLKKSKFDYTNYVPRKKKEIKCESCSKIIHKGSEMCKPCRAKSNVNNGNLILKQLPDIETLNKMIWMYPIATLCKKFDMSDVGLTKRIKKLGLSKPPRGYWLKKRTGEESNLH